MSVATARKDKLRIGEVAKRAGVPTSVITFYIGAGLLPKPVKTSRNMAYYAEDTVERVKLIRELQQKAFLPLRVVKKVMRSGASLAEIRASFAGRLSSVVPPGTATPVDESALIDLGLSKRELSALERMRVLSPKRGRYSAEDAIIVEQIVRMRRAGLTPARGYGVEQMRIYKDAVEQLAAAEIRLGAEGIADQMSTAELHAAAPDWIDAANRVLCALHKKVMESLLAQVGA